MAIKTRNAVIKSVMLGLEDHGIMTAWVHLEWDGGGQGFGGYALDSYDKDSKKRVATIYLGHFVSRVLETVGVDAWEKLPGKPVRMRAEWNKVHEIGHYIKDEWFNPSEEFERIEKANA